MQKYKSKLVGLGAALLTVLTLAVSSTSSDVVYATDTEPEVDTVTTTIGDRKIVEDMIKLDASKLDGSNSDTMASVVEGADGLMYVVANPEGELVYDENEVDYSKDLLDKIKTGNVGANDHTTGAIEVGIDKERQKEADAADTGVKDFDDVDYNNIEDLQSALNDDDFPFIEGEAYEKAMDEAESVSEQEEIFAQTPVFFASRILTMTQNFNDVPTVAKSSSMDTGKASSMDTGKASSMAIMATAMMGTASSSSMAIMATASSSLSRSGTINPPSGYDWIFITDYYGKAFTYDRYYYTTINGTPAFCIEEGVPHGTTYTKSSTTSPITQTQLNNVAALIAAWQARGGWTNNEAGYKRYIGAQLAIWDWTNHKLGTVLITPNWKDGILENRQTLKDIANSIKRSPTYDKTSTTVSKGSNAVFTINSGATFHAAGKDHVLGVSADNGATVSLSGNKITVNTSNVAAGKTVTVTVKKGYNQGAYNTPQVWNSGSKQKVVTGRYVITQKLTVNVRAKGRVQVTKTDATSGAKLAGAKFRFSYSGTSREVTTNTNGVALLPVDLDEGTTVTVVETAAPAGYQLNSSSFTIKASNNPSSPTNTTRTNARSVGSLKVIKTGDLDGKRMQNAKFTIYRSDQTTVQTTVTTNSNGEAQVNNLPLGTYYAKETTAPVGYHLNTTMHKLTVTASTTSSTPATVTVSNAYIKPTVTKTVTDANESAKTSNTWTAATSDFLQYDLKTSVIRKSGQHNLSSLVITDNYDKDRLDVAKVEVFQGSTNVTSQFTTSTNTSTGVITATATAASLTNGSFYDKDYTLRTTMKLKNAIRTGSSSAKAQISMSKSGSIAIKGTATASNSSNAVTTILPVATVTATHNLSTKNGSAYTKIATLNTAATKYYYGENYSASKIADGKYATSTTTYYYQYDTASGAATRTGTVTGNTNLNFEYVPITIGSPTKTVSDSDQSNVTSNTMTLNETITYRVNQALPGALSGIKLTSFSFEDAIDSRYTIVSKKVMQGSTDVTSQFTDGSSGNNIKFTAKAANLAATSFYGETYTLQIQVKLDRAKIPDGSSKATQTISNTGTVKFDNISRTTNTTTTSLPVYTMTYKHTLVPTASASASPIATLASGSDTYYRGENYSYTKRADGRATFNNTVYYYNFATALGNATYTGTATADASFDFYYTALTVAQPTKTVTDSNEVNKVSNTLEYGETFTYKVNHALQSQLGSAKFGSYVITDTVSSNLDIVSKRIINSAGTDVTSKFTDGTSGNVVKYTAKAAELANSSFYGTTYTLEIKVKVKASAMKTDNTKTELTFTNNATFTHDNVSKTTNTVTSKLPVYTLNYTHTLLKSNTKTDTIGSLGSGSAKYYNGQSYTYSKLADTRVTLNGTLYYYNFIPSLGNATYTGKVTKNDTFNFYYLSIVVNTPTKRVTDSDQTDVTSNTLLYNETFTYKVNHTLQSQLGTAKFASYAISDTVSANLDIVSKRIINSAGTDVTTKFTDGTSGNNVKYTAKAAELAKADFYGTTYTLEIKVKVKASALKTDNSKTALSFSNTATFVHDNVSKTTNTVTSNLPVYTMNYKHTLVKTNSKTDTIGTLKSGSDKYYRGQSYKYDKMADGRQTLNNVLYYFNFIPSFGNASYSGTATSNQNFDFYYLSIVVNTPTKTVTDSDQRDVTSNTLLYNETYTYNMKHTLQKELGTARFASYVLTDAVDSKLTIVSKRVINGAGTDVTSLFTDNSAGNTVKFTAKTAELAKASFYGTTYTVEIKVKVATSALKTDNSKEALTFTNSATFVHDNVTKTTNTVTSNLPVYTMTYGHSLLKTAKTSDLIGSMKSGSDKYYRGQAYKYDKMADGRITLGSTLYYYNFIPALGNASYSGTATSNQTFNFYYLSIVVNTPTKTVTDSNQTNVTTNQIKAYEQFKYSVKHVVQQQLATAKFGTYVLQDTVDSRLTVVSSRILDGSGNNVTSLFDNKTSGNTVRYDAKAASLNAASFYNKTYNLEITVKVSDATLNAAGSGKRTFTMPNTGRLTHDGVVKNTGTTNTTLPAYRITINHKDVKTDAQLAQDIDYKYDGENYRYNPRTDLYDTDTPKNNYKSQTVHTGTINGRDITLETLYHIPVYTVNVDTIRIDTAKAGTGGTLPVQLTLSEYKEYPDELDKIRYTITVTDTTNSNRVVYTRNMTVANFASTLNFTVPSNYLTKNSKVNYRVSIAPTANPEENDFNTQSGAVTTHGYTSSEKVLTNSDLLLNRIDYSAVIRTFKERTRSTVQEYKERIVYDFTPEERSKTGYGFDINLDPTYTNELNRQATIDLSIVSPLAMIKGDTKNGIDSYLIDQYPAVGSTVTIPLERMSLSNTTSAGTRRMVYDFELPHINIEPKTGILFTDEQVAAPHAAIQDPTAVMVDGGRQFYVPIWTDLGDYDIFVRSNNTFGDNLIRINMNKDIDVYAYMYGTIDSDTIDDDELVVEPVYPDTEMPDDWDDDEKDWVLNP